MRDSQEQALMDAIGDEVEQLSVFDDPEVVAPSLEQRGHDLAQGTPGRAAWLSYAGERWEAADEPERALRCYEDALADGGATWIDARASLVSVLIELGDTSRADTLLDELRRDLAKGPLCGPVHEYVGEQLELAGRREEALRWFTAGIVHAENDGDPVQAYGCLTARFRVRRSLGLPNDHSDEAYEQRRRGLGPQLEPWPALENDDAPDAWRGDPPLRLTVLYWPPDEFDSLLARWPALAEDYGDAHAEHRALLEHKLRELSEEGTNASVTPGAVEEYLEFVAAEGHDPADGATRANYAAQLGVIEGRTIAWPPGRNEACWCSSGVKYKKCCGALRFPAE